MKLCCLHVVVNAEASRGVSAANKARDRLTHSGDWMWSLLTLTDCLLHAYRLEQILKTMRCGYGMPSKSEIWQTKETMYT